MKNDFRGLVLLLGTPLVIALGLEGIAFLAGVTAF